MSLRRIQLAQRRGRMADALNELLRFDDLRHGPPAKNPALNLVQAVQPQGEFQAAVRKVPRFQGLVPNPLLNEAYHLRPEADHHLVVALARSAKRRGGEEVT